MTVAERILRCRVIEKIEKNKSYAQKIGVENISKSYKYDKVYREINK